MTRFEPGDVVLVRFPFTDLSQSKKRPALVISPADFTDQFGDVVVVPLTSQPQASDALQLKSWKQAGLLKESSVKPILGTLSSRLLIRRLGRRAKEDHPMVAIAIRSATDSRFLK